MSQKKKKIIRKTNDSEFRSRDEDETSDTQTKDKVCCLVKFEMFTRFNEEINKGTL